MINAPIILFVYNRPWHTQQTIEALAANKGADEVFLYVFADGPKAGAGAQDLQKINDVREYIKTQQYFKHVDLIESATNKGLATSIIEGVTAVLSKHNNAIILEDDLITAPYFLDYMNSALEKFGNTDEVISIHGYCEPIVFDEPAFFLRGADCWGWATWKRGWNLFEKDAVKLKKELLDRHLKYDFDYYGTFPYFKMLEKQIKGEVDSWAIRWYASAFLKNKLTLYPSRSLVKNIGQDGSGTHVQADRSLEIGLPQKPINLDNIVVEESGEARKKISEYFFRNMGLKSKLQKILKLGY